MVEEVVNVAEAPAVRL